MKSANLAVREYTAKRNQVKIALDRTRLYAPFDGVIAEFNARVGDYVDQVTAEPGKILVPIVLIDPSLFEVTLELTPWDGASVQEGQTAWVTPDSPTLSAQRSNQADLPGIVHSVSPAVSETRRMIRVRLRLKADAKQLRKAIRHRKNLYRRKVQCPAYPF